MVAESPPKPGLIKALLNNEIAACNGGGWEASDASQTSLATARIDERATDDEADKRRLSIKQLQGWFSEESSGSWKGFEEIEADILGLLGNPEAQRIIDEVLNIEKAKNNEIAELLENAKPKAKGNASSGKRAKGKASQRKGYG